MLRLAILQSIIQPDDLALGNSFIQMDMCKILSERSVTQTSGVLSHLAPPSCRIHARRRQHRTSTVAPLQLTWGMHELGFCQIMAS